MFAHHQKREKPNFIGESTAEFPFWADSFQGLIMRHWNLLHVITVNRAVRLQMINALGINAVQQYRDQETAWSFLLDACLQTYHCLCPAEQEPPRLLHARLDWTPKGFRPKKRPEL
eukprot:3932048-Rhodomonas_salina.2